jgi:hypothetical protein
MGEDGADEETGVGESNQGGTGGVSLASVLSKRWLIRRSKLRARGVSNLSH